jgi:hypothetical protein
MPTTTSPIQAWNIIRSEVFEGRDATAAARFGNARLVASLAGLLRAFPGADHDVEWVIADRHRVAAWVRLSPSYGYAIALELEGDRVADFRFVAGVASLAKI